MGVVRAGAEWGRSRVGVVRAVREGLRGGKGGTGPSAPPPSSFHKYHTMGLWESVGEICGAVHQWGGMWRSKAMLLLDPHHAHACCAPPSSRTATPATMLPHIMAMLGLSAVCSIQHSTCTLFRPGYASTIYQAHCVAVYDGHIHTTVHTHAIGCYSRHYNDCTFSDAARQIEALLTHVVCPMPDTRRR